MSFVTSKQVPILNFTYFPCEMEDIYVDSLKEGEMLVSYQPYMIINTNGLVVGLNESFKQFYYLDQNKNLLTIQELVWNDDCSAEIQTTQRQISNESNTLTLMWLYPLILVGLGIGVFYVRKSH